MSKEKKRIVFLVDEDDKEINDWLSCQENVGESMRLLIRKNIIENGNKDFKTQLIEEALNSSGKSTRKKTSRKQTAQKEPVQKIVKEPAQEIIKEPVQKNIEEPAKKNVKNSAAAKFFRT